MPMADLKQLPEAVNLHLVDVREVDAPKGTEPIHWLLLTSHMIEAFGQARLMLEFYRKRWIIEEFDLGRIRTKIKNCCTICRHYPG